MIKIDQLCKFIVTRNSKIQAVAVVDASSGLLLSAYHKITDFEQSFIDTLAATATEFFNNYSANDLENNETLQEIHMITVKNNHFMTLVPCKSNAIAIFITDKKINVSEMWSEIRTATRELAPTCP